MENPPESVEVVDYFAAGTTEKNQGFKVGQVADEHESLPQHLKWLFQYCSLFPSGYEFSKDELIQLWIAEGFIRERQNQKMEETASEHFNSLEKEGFFVLSRCDFTSVLSAPIDNLSNFMYKVNPIKHSILEDTISSGYYFRAIDGKLAGASEMTRHLSLICEYIDGMTFGILQNFKQLRTLHLLSCRGSSIKHVPRDFCFTLTFLRTLNLSGTLISELPSSIGNVKSLRYIDASHTPISRLPESIDSLHKLQTIRLRGCMHFVQLPKGMMKLSNLRHIDLDIIRQLNSMPAHIGNLSNLQTLPAFLVGRDVGCHVGELKNLNDLKGAFNISRLENVLSKEEAGEAYLIDKKCIHSLELRWSNLFVEYAEQQEKVLECLQPHSGLKELQIQQYSGSILPPWISNPAFADLVVITLYRCRNCKLLPCMGQLPALKSLSIIEVNEVKEINHQFFRNGPVDHAFPKLERLEVDIMLNLKEWMDVQMGDLPSLVKLTVDSCPELVTIPPLSCLKSLKHLEFRRCPKLLSLPTDGLPTSLESFLILDCLELKEWFLNSEHWSMLCHVPSVWFDNEERPRGITHQLALAQVTAEAAEAESCTQISTECSSLLSAAPATSLTQLPSFTCKTMEPQEMPSKMPDSVVKIKKSSDISHFFVADSSGLGQQEIAGQSVKLVSLGDMNGSKGKLKDPGVSMMKASLKGCQQNNAVIQVASCLVDGCNSNLSLCWVYHRRHRVCELHSKTPKVTIQGQEKRFCQQCSRFHSLGEFDEGKRSCRKRLAGHNRRRRKPQPASASSVAFLSGVSQYDGSLPTSSPNPDSPSYHPLHCDGYMSDDTGHTAHASSINRRGHPWTEEEHRMFLIGLQKYGSGDWRGIAQNYVMTKTPTQVASHAQKYFIRQSGSTGRKRHSSLFDMAMDPPHMPEEQALLPFCQEERESEDSNSLPALNLFLGSCSRPMESTHEKVIIEPDNQHDFIPACLKPFPFPDNQHDFIPACLKPFPFPVWPPSAGPLIIENGGEGSHHQQV